MFDFDAVVWYNLYVKRRRGNAPKELIMKKLYLVNTNGTREFWTVDDEQMILRSLYSNESVDAENCDGVEDDSSWDETELTSNELDHLFDDVDIIDERDF